MEELIKKCVCGKSEFISFRIFDNIRIKECLSCGIKHQLVMSSYDDYMRRYKIDYSCEEGKDGGQLISQERYDHDYQIAEKRFKTYKGIINEDHFILDIGCGNGAFVDYLLSQDYCIKELEFCENYEGRFVDYNGDFIQIDLSGLKFDILTMHDVLEHFVDPFEALMRCSEILNQKGILIIDFPDFFHLEGLHHWKKDEHLWMFRKEELEKLLRTCGFDIIKVEKPIPSKLVFYAARMQG